MNYTYDWEKRTGTDYAEFMNPATRYEKTYYQINVYNSADEWINFGFVDDINDTEAVLIAVNEVIEWDNTPPGVFERMHSRFD